MRSDSHNLFCLKKFYRPAIFVSKYGLENFVVVADSSLMNNANIAELEAHGYKYIIGAKTKNESQEVKN